MYRRSRINVEIDITYLCNLQCHNCNRSLGEGQVPSRDRMTVAQVRRFLEDSVEAKTRYNRLRLIGGEPTLHPQFNEIVRLVVDYRNKHWPDAKIEVNTNGYGAKVNRILSTIPEGVDKIRNTSKESNDQPDHVSFNVAPLDVEEYRKSEYANGCWITDKCGLGVTPYGYYPCAVAGSIDRIFGFDLGRKKFPDSKDDMLNELRKFCALCGHFKRDDHGVGGPLISSSWKKAYAQAARHDRITLSRLPEYEESGSGQTKQESLP